MSLNAIHTSVMIFASSQEKAEEKLLELENDLDEEILIRRRDFIQTKSDTYRAKKFHEGCRGYRYQKVYVDRLLMFDENIVESIVVKLVPPSYYDMSRFGEKWDWREHFILY